MNNRCFKCNKKTLLTFDCKCEKHFCTHHRLPENHNCDKLFDIQRCSKEINTKKVMDYSIKPEQFVKLE